MAVEIDAGPRPEWGVAEHCPACEGVVSDAAYIRDRYGWAWPLASCRHCGVKYQACPITDAARRDFYGRGRYRQLCAQVTGQPWDEPEFLRHEQCEYGYLWHTFVTLHGRVLDYGGSTGEVSAILAADADTIIVADYGDGAAITPEQALAVPKATYDAILCCQTLDHLREPLQTLRQFLRVATPGARLFVDVVKLAHTQFKLDHDTYYPTATSFLGLVERSGWTPLWLDAETHPSHYSVLAVAP